MSEIHRYARTRDSTVAAVLASNQRRYRQWIASLHAWGAGCGITAPAGLCAVAHPLLDSYCTGFAGVDASVVSRLPGAWDTHGALAPASSNPLHAEFTALAHYTPIPVPGRPGLLRSLDGTHSSTGELFTAGPWTYSGVRFTPRQDEHVSPGGDWVPITAAQFTRARNARKSSIRTSTRKKRS